MHDETDEDGDSDEDDEEDRSDETESDDDAETRRMNMPCTPRRAIPTVLLEKTQQEMEVEGSDDKDGVANKIEDKDAEGTSTTFIRRRKDRSNDPLSSR